MANLRGRIFAQDSSRRKEVSRLASQYIVAHVDTWKTFIDLRLNADGSGEVEILRIITPNYNPAQAGCKEVIHSYRIEAE